MYIITLILGIIGVVLLAFAIREDEDDRAFPLGIHCTLGCSWD